MRPTISSSLRDIQLELLYQFFLGFGFNLDNRADEINNIIDDVNRRVDVVRVVKAIRAFSLVTAMIPVNRSKSMTPCEAASAAFLRTLKKVYPEYKLVDADFQVVNSLSNAYYAEVVMPSSEGTRITLLDAKRIYDQIRLIGEATVRS